jgi:hypothetical protein
MRPDRTFSIRTVRTFYWANALLNLALVSWAFSRNTLNIFHIVNTASIFLMIYLDFTTWKKDMIDTAVNVAKEI